MKFAGARVAALLALAVTASLPAPAYYYFVHYLNGTNAPEKFDLTALPQKTVTFFVSQQGPTTFNSTDSFNSVLSQVRQATGVWNGITTSDLRVAFGGFGSSAQQNTPGGDVVFEDLPPGLYGYGGPTSDLAPAGTGATTFIPILRSAVHLNRNLTVLPGPSYNETFFMTVVHEMGHALGLQHTFTSATMSTATTRATSLSHAIDTDDIAGISQLYPNAAFSQLGSISGRVTINGQPAHMVSVVAIRGNSGAVSAMTAADGTYRIDGIPPGQYFVYAHTIPPDADIRGPWDVNGNVVAGSAPTNTLFYPGTTNLQSATAVPVQSGQVYGGVNIGLAARSTIDIYDVGIYGYFNNNTIAVKPAYVDALNGNTTVVASGVGLGQNGQAPGLGAQLMGGSAFFLQNGVRPYAASGYTYIALDMSFSLGGTTGLQHVVFNTPSYMYVLPAGINITNRLPPTVNYVGANPDGSLTVAGLNWASDTKIYFDGLPSTILSISPQNNTAIVLAPPGANGQTATITAYNSDGQNSQFVQPTSPTTWPYGNSATPSIVSISPSSLPAGTEGLVTITGANYSFVQNLMTVGFGTSDILVRRVYVTGPNTVMVEASVAPNAALSNPDVSVFSGFQTSIAPAGFQIAPAVPGMPLASSVLQNAISGLNGAYAGAVVTITGSNLTVSGSLPSVTFNGVQAAVVTSSPTQLNVIIPPSTPAGPAVMVVSNGSQTAPALVVNIDSQPASITAIQNQNAAFISSRTPAHPGDLLTATMTSPVATGSAITSDRVQVSVGGVMRQALQVVSSGGTSWQVSFLLNPNEQLGPSQNVIVYLDGRSSIPTTIPVARPDGSYVNVSDGSGN